MVVYVEIDYKFIVIFKQFSDRFFVISIGI